MRQVSTTLRMRLRNCSPRWCDQQPASEPAGVAGALGDLAQAPDDMRPAKLMLLGRQPAIHPVAVADDDARGLLAKQMLRAVAGAHGQD